MDTGKREVIHIKYRWTQAREKSYTLTINSQTREKSYTSTIDGHRWEEG